MSREVIIIGGGVAGLAAAVFAIENGFRPIILERNRYLGGRVRSFFAQDLRQRLDNGQHVLSASYKNTNSFLAKIGSLNKIDYQQNLSVTFIKDSQNMMSFRPLALPSPFHFFTPLLLNRRFTSLTLNKSLGFVKKNQQMKEAALRQMTVKEWLDYCDHYGEIRDVLWKPLTAAILNTNIEEASAFLLYNTILRSFLHSRQSARLGLPGDWLASIFADPAEEYIINKGGSIYRLIAASKFILTEGRITSVITRNQQFDAPAVISTIPPHALNAILANSQIPDFDALQSDLDKFEYNCIITINIFMEKPISAEFPMALIGSPIQWVFPHPEVKKQNNSFGYALVISAADVWKEQSAAEIMEMVNRELRRLLDVDIHKTHRLISYKIIKEKRATISQTPASLTIRPGVKTATDNFFLAGDWTDTGLPATIESAVLSGIKAVDALVAARKRGME